MDPELLDLAWFAGTAFATMALSRAIDYVRGLEGSHDIADVDDRDSVDQVLLFKLEQWELFWRQGCYNPQVKCPHDTPPIVTHDRWGRPHVHLNPELKCERLESEFSRVYRFDALVAHTEQINEMIERNKVWIRG